MTLEEAIKIIKDTAKQSSELPQYRQLVFDYDLLDAALVVLEAYENHTDTDTN